MESRSGESKLKLNKASRRLGSNKNSFAKKRKEKNVNESSRFNGIRCSSNREPLPSSEKEESLKSKKKKDDKLRDGKKVDSN